jgi:hypothetical protein
MIFPPKLRSNIKNVCFLLIFIELCVYTKLKHDDVKEPVYFFRTFFVCLLAVVNNKCC